MRLLIAGVFSAESTNTPMAGALKRAGHDVTRFAYRDMAAQSNNDQMNNALYLAAKEQDAVIICKGFGDALISAEMLRMLKPVTVYWLPDNIEVCGGMAIQLALSCKIACATGLVSCQNLVENHHKCVNQIFEGVNPKMFRPWSDEFGDNVVFAGSMTPHRQDMLDALDCAGIPVERITAYGRELSQAYSKAGIVLNFVHGEIFSDRVTQAVASGAFCLTETCKDIEAAFDVGLELDTFRSWNGLVIKTKHYLGNREERGRMRKVAGAKSIWTWRGQMNKVIDVLCEKRIADGAFVIA